MALVRAKPQVCIVNSSHMSKTQLSHNEGVIQPPTPLPTPFLLSLITFLGASSHLASWHGNNSLNKLVFLHLIVLIKSPTKKSETTLGQRGERAFPLGLHFLIQWK